MPPSYDPVFSYHQRFLGKREHNTILYNIRAHDNMNDNIK